LYTFEVLVNKRQYAKTAATEKGCKSVANNVFSAKDYKTEI
jgi:hypothetical protein